MKINQDKTITSRKDFFYYTFRNIILVSVPLVIISGLVLSHLSFHSSALESSSDKVNLVVPVSCNLTANIPSGKEHTISMVSGTYEDEIGETILKTSCNDANGYVVYAIGNTDNTEGKNVLSTMIGSTYDIPTGTATSGDTSQWAMKLTAVSSSTPSDTPTIATGYDNYSTVPNQWTKVVYKDAGTVNVETGSSFTTTYAIYLKGLQPAGTYSGQVKYVMFHPSSTGTPASTINEAFANANKTPVSVLDPETGQMGSFYKMQDMNTGICESVAGSNESTTARLVDIRDNKLYYVTKLDDGHCWMTENLDLDLVSGVALTSDTTDLNDGSGLGAYSVGYNYNSASNVISWIPTNTTRDYQNNIGTPWGSSHNVAYSLDPGEWYWDGDDSTPNCNYLDPSKDCTHFTQHRTSTGRYLPVGNYYNWSAAIASDGSGSLSANTYNDINLNPRNSICPKGWRLPIVSNVSYAVTGSTNEFARLNYLYNGGGSTDPKLISAPLWFVRSGIVGINGSLQNPGANGYYWSSTVYDDGYAYLLIFGQSRVSPAAASGSWVDSGRYMGRSVRCVAR